MWQYFRLNIQIPDEIAYHRCSDQTAYVEKMRENVYFLIVERGLCFCIAKILDFLTNQILK